MEFVEAAKGMTEASSERQMLVGDTLVFLGTRYPRATLTVDEAEPLYAQPFPIKRIGKGRAWMATKPEGFWRDFADLDLGSPDEVLGFIRRRGDPYGDRSTWDWHKLASFLKELASSWGQVDVDGVSRTLPDANQSAMEHFLRRDATRLLLDLHVIPNPNGTLSFALEAKSLAAFMVASALSSHSRKVAMRHCRKCGSWFELVRKDQLFCSASCRTQFSMKGA